MTISFVLGNGKSRSSIDFLELKKYGKIFGCNALYRDYTPDVLVATDPEISTEIMNSGYALNNKFYTRNPIAGKGANQIQEFFGYSSGPVALSLACQESTKIFLLGFDLKGIEGKFNNIYADTKFYKKSNQTETYYGNWVNQIFDIANKFKHCQIIHVVGSSTHIPKEWESVIRSTDSDSFQIAINNNKLEQL
jgi:hypothetical protein